MVRTNAYLCAHPSYAPSELSHNGADSWGSAALHPRLWLFRAFGAGVISLRCTPGYSCFAPAALPLCEYCLEFAPFGRLIHFPKVAQSA